MCGATSSGAWQPTRTISKSRCALASVDTVTARITALLGILDTATLTFRFLEVLPHSVTVPSLTAEIARPVIVVAAIAAKIPERKKKSHQRWGYHCSATRLTSFRYATWSRRASCLFGSKTRETRVCAPFRYAAKDYRVAISIFCRTPLSSRWPDKRKHRRMKRFGM